VKKIENTKSFVLVLIVIATITPTRQIQNTILEQFNADSLSTSVVKKRRLQRDNCQLSLEKVSDRACLRFRGKAGLRFSTL
jgi:hypothetical protein